VRRTVLSVCNQSLADYELLVVDDGSTDGTVEAVLACAGEHLRTPAELRVFSQENRGPGAARNRGLREARGDLIAFLDADDLWSPEYLAKVAEIYRRFPQIQALASNSYDQRSRGYFVNVRPEDGDVLMVSDFFKAQRDRTIVVRTSGVTVRREIVEQVGGMREDLLRAQDTEYWARLAASNVRWGFSYEPLVLYNGVRAESVSNNPLRFKNAPSPENWSKDIWPLLDSEMRDSFRESYLRYARMWCWQELQAGVDHQARETAKEALRRTRGWRSTLFLVAVRFIPGAIHRVVWRVGSRVKRVLYRSNSSTRVTQLGFNVVPSDCAELTPGSGPSRPDADPNLRGFTL
jgi:glycosyltransferase involved in cell wall biosynthesis